MRALRRLVYRLGYRPEPTTTLGAILFSPSLAMHYAYLDAAKAFEEGYNRGRAIFLDREGFEIKMHPCKAPGCGKTDNEKAMAFQRSDWCCENHRKIVMGEKKPEEE